MGGAAPGKKGHNIDYFCVRLEPFKEETIREHLAQHDVIRSGLETRYGTEGNGPSRYIQERPRKEHNNAACFM